VKVSIVRGFVFSQLRSWGFCSCAISNRVTA